jgi:1-acyl-sn-glycerol-3-phosphate acyltransferase
MQVWIYRLLSAAAAGGALRKGLTPWAALLTGLGTFAGINLLYVLFWVAVAQTVDDTKPIQEQKKIYRLGVADIASTLCSYAHVHTELSGEELLPKDRRFLMVCNHRAAFDPIVKASVLKDYNLAFITKPSNLQIPLIASLAYGAGFIPLNRENDREALKSILQAIDYLKRDLCSMVVYPEGTRTRTGKLLPFHAGSFKIAQKAKVPVVVAAIQGTENVGKNFPFRRTDVKLDILELIPVEEVTAVNTQELSSRCRSRIAAHLCEEAAK